MEPTDSLRMPRNVIAAGTASAWPRGSSALRLGEVRSAIFLGPSLTCLCRQVYILCATSTYIVLHADVVGKQILIQPGGALPAAAIPCISLGSKIYTLAQTLTYRPYVCEHSLSI